MRYDTPIYFQRVIQGEYNKATGDYDEDTVEETARYASVMNTGTDTMRLLYGEIRQGGLTVHIQNRYNGPFDRIRIGNKVYAVDRRRTLRTKESFVLSEVQ